MFSGFRASQKIHIRYDLRSVITMGMFDEFYPQPPIGCARSGCTGKLIEWQGKYHLCCLFQWRQGMPAPFDQSASEDCKLDPPRLSKIRLPKNDSIPAAHGHCDQCDAGPPFHIECITDADGCWTATKVIGQVAAGQILEPGWVQCAKCLDAIHEVAGKEVYTCPGCKSIIFLRTELLPAKRK